MKKLYAVYLCIFLSIPPSFAQQVNPKPLNFSSQKFQPVQPASGVIIGQTTYDMQSNAASGNRISYANGQVVATWNQSSLLSQPYPDRGTAYNFYDGINWIPVTTTSIDSCAWSNIDIGSNTEYVVGQARPPATNDLTLLTRTPVGSGTWQKFPLPADPNGHQTLWPRMSVGGPNDNSIHVIALSKPLANGGMLNNGIDGALTYSRSQDGGATWDKIHTLLPGIDISNYLSMSAECYAIDVKGSTIAVVYGSLICDWVLWKSVDNGDTWFRQIIKALPFPPPYDQVNMITDADGDGVADTIPTVDGSLEVLIDNMGMVHAWSGNMTMIQTGVGQGVGYFPQTDGLLYWNENFGMFPPVLLAMGEDIDANGIITFPPGTGGYQYSLTSMPSAGCDDQQNIFLVYSSIVENTDDGSGKGYRNVYAMYSNNNGMNWSTPFRIDPSDFDEQVYPSMPRDVDSQLRVIQQQDSEAGISLLNGHPPTMNDIIYYGQDTTQLFGSINPYPVNSKFISGAVFGDANQNKYFDSGDFAITNQNLSLSPANDSTITNSAGGYTFLVLNGNYTVNYNVPTGWVLTTDSTSYSVNVNNSSILGLNFGLFPTAITTQYASDMTPSSPRCNSSMNFWLNFVNTGSTFIQGHARYVMDSQMSLLNSFPTVTSSTADTLYWNLGTFAPFQSKTISLEMSTAGLMPGINISNCASFSMDPTFSNSRWAAISPRPRPARPRPARPRPARPRPSWSRR